METEPKCSDQYPLNHNTVAGLHHIALHVQVDSYKRLLGEADAFLAGMDSKQAKELRERIGYVIAE